MNNKLQPATRIRLLTNILWAVTTLLVVDWSGSIVYGFMDRCDQLVAEFNRTIKTMEELAPEVIAKDSADAANWAKAHNPKPQWKRPKGRSLEERAEELGIKPVVK